MPDTVRILLEVEGVSYREAEAIARQLNPPIRPDVRSVRPPG